MSLKFGLSVLRWRANDSVEGGQPLQPLPVHLYHLNYGESQVPQQLNLIDEVCPMCMKPESEVGELHEEDQLCRKCEGEWVEQYESILL